MLPLVPGSSMAGIPNDKYVVLPVITSRYLSVAQHMCSASLWEAAVSVTPTLGSVRYKQLPESL